MRTCMHLPRNPGVHFAILAQHTIRPNEQRRIEHRSRILRILLNETTGLHIHAILLAEAKVRSDHILWPECRVLKQFLHCGVHRCAMRKLREYEESYIMERRVPGERPFRHLHKLVHPRRHVFTLLQGR